MNLCINIGVDFVLSTVQFANKFTVCIDQNAYLAKFFARHEELHAFDVQVSTLLMYATILASYAARNLYVLIRIPTRDRFSVHENFLTSRFTQYGTDLMQRCSFTRVRARGHASPRGTTLELEWYHT